MAKNSRFIDRRTFIKSASGATATAMMAFPHIVAGQSSGLSPNDKLNLAFVGVGGKGATSMSSRIVDVDLLDYVNSRADQVKSVYLSTGGSTLAEIRQAVKHLNRIENLCLLHCVSQYPTDDSNVNLRALQTIKNEFPEHRIGYSDHSRGIEACIAAIVLGADVLEKHFTFNTRLPGDDHAGAMTPEMLSELVRRIDRLEVMLGSSEKAMRQ